MPARLLPDLISKKVFSLFPGLNPGAVIRSSFFRCLLIALLFSASCHTFKKITVHRVLTEKHPENLVSKMDSAEFIPKWMSAKISAESSIGDKSNSFSANLRIRTDSVIWLSISSLGIEAARIIITRDSVKVVDRINSKYELADFSYINRVFQLATNFDMLQSLLLGNYFPYLDARKLRSSYVDGDFYLLSTLRRRKLKRELEEKEPNKRIIQDVWLDPASFRIEKMSVDDNKLKKKLIAVYEDFQPVESTFSTDTVQIAHQVTFTIESEKPASIKLSYSKIILDKVQEFPFSIPEKYEPMK